MTSDAAEGALPDAAHEPDAKSPDEDPTESELEPDVPLFQSGSRLQTRVLKHGGQVVARESLFDTELDGACRFLRSADGAFRCLPDVSASLDTYPVYADAACSKPATLMTGACDEAPRFHLVQSHACDAQSRVFEVEPTASHTWYARNASGACVAQTDAWRRAFALGKEVPASRFVSAALKRTRRSDKSDALVREVWLGSDGSLATRGAAAAAGGACEPMLLQREGTHEEAPLRCVPTARAYRAAETFFADAACSELLAHAAPSGPTCAAPEVVVDLPFGGSFCQIGGRPKRLYAPGQALERAYVKEYDQSCVATESPAESDYAYFAIQAPVASEALPQLAVSPVGEGRLQPLLWRSDAGQALGHALASVGSVSVPVLWDDMLDTRCEPQRLAGKALCVPPEAMLAYADAACQQPLLELLDAADCPLEAQTLVSIRGPFEASCAEPADLSALSVYRLGEPRAAPSQRYVRVEGQCREAPTQAFVARYFALGESVALERLAELESGLE